MLDEEETGKSATDGRTAVWLALSKGRPGGSVVAFWDQVDAVAHAEALRVANPGERPLVREVVVRGVRRRWRHADDANDLGDHTAEA